MAVGKTAGAAATYIVLAGLQRGISLILLPFVTHAMSPAEYGAAAMLAAASMFTTAVVAAPIMPIVIRAVARDDDDGPALLRIAGIYCYVIVPILATVGAFAFALAVNSFLGVSGKIWAVEILAVGLQPAASVFALSAAQAREDLLRFAAISSTSVIVTAASKLFFVVVMREGVWGWVVSDLVSAVTAAGLAAVLVRVPRATVEAGHRRFFLTFTLPLIPHTASMWALTFMSRPAMAAVSTFEQVGLLSFGLNLAQVAGLLLAEANRAALPRYSREQFPAPTDQTIGVARAQVVAAFLIPAAVGGGVALVGPWMFDKAYWQSFALTGILLVSQLAYGLYLIPMNYLTQTAGLPRYSALASGAGATIIFGATFAIGDRYGALGVAYATAVAYLVMATMAVVLVFAYKLRISWSAWRSSWVEVALSAASLACSVAALESDVGSRRAHAYTLLCLVLLVTAAALTIRRVRS